MPLRKGALIIVVGIVVGGILRQHLAGALWLGQSASLESGIRQVDWWRQLEVPPPSVAVVLDGQVGGGYRYRQELIRGAGRAQPHPAGNPLADHDDVRNVDVDAQSPGCAVAQGKRLRGDRNVDAGGEILGGGRPVAAAHLVGDGPEEGADLAARRVDEPRQVEAARIAAELGIGGEEFLRGDIQKQAGVRRLAQLRAARAAILGRGSGSAPIGSLRRRGRRFERGGELVCVPARVHGFQQSGRAGDVGRGH